MEPVDWPTLFQGGPSPEPMVVKALTYRRFWDSACRAVHVSCDDGNDYVVKGSQVGRSAFNDQVVGRIATELGAPVAAVCLVDVDAELIRINRDMAHLSPGLVHGSRYVPDCTECRWLQYVDEPGNRPRFALLALLYGWMVGAEKQFFYSITPPNLVYSFDHDAFFPDGPAWTIASLSAASFPEEDEVLVTQCGLRRSEMNQAVRYLDRMSPQIIASAISVVPASLGGVGDPERVALADYLWDRCQIMRN